MKIDWYTKMILTIIAASLVWLSLGGPSLMIPVEAQKSEIYIAGYIYDGKPVAFKAPQDRAAEPAIPVRVSAK